MSHLHGFGGDVANFGRRTVPDHPNSPPDSRVHDRLYALQKLISETNVFHGTDQPL
jgi:hypothetical protein